MMMPRCNVPRCQRAVANNGVSWVAKHGRCTICRTCELHGVPFMPGGVGNAAVVGIYCQCRGPVVTDGLGECSRCQRITREACERSLGIEREAAA